MTISHLTDAWTAAGIETGDAVLIHSSCKRIAKLLGSPDPIGDILASFRRAVGPRGMLLFPLFNFDWCAGKPRGQSEMGALTERAEIQPDATITQHPVYAFAIIGRYPWPLNNKSAYGEHSPFAWLHECGGKIAVLDLDERNSMTSYHYVEEMLKVPYRFMKDFRGWTIYVRQDGVKTDVYPMGEILWDRGIWKGEREGVGYGLRVAKMNEIFDATAEIIRSGKAEGTLYARMDARPIPDMPEHNWSGCQADINLCTEAYSTQGI